MSDLVVRGEVLPVGQLSLFELAEIANTEHLLVLRAGVEMVEHAIKAGEALNAAKAQGRHGEWLPWLSTNFEASEDTAERYMLVARNSATVRNLLVELAEPTMAKVLRALSNGGAHVGKNSGENNWFTPVEITDAARRVMGAIDLDPASTDVANEGVAAEQIFTEDDDGLQQEWAGAVWMNPPYAQPLIALFCDKLVREYSEGRVREACVLVNNATEAAWFQTLARVSSGFCFPSGRVRFWHPDRLSAPLQGQAIVYLGGSLDRFRAEFGAFGFTVAS